MGAPLLLLFTKPEGVLGGAAPWVTPTDIPAAEAAALKSLYNLTNGASWTTSTNWGKTATAANWYGLTVAVGHVYGISLTSNNLAGNISTWDMSGFTTLQTLYLSTNSLLVGDITGWVWNASLQLVYLNSTGISGGDPAWTWPAGLVQLRLQATSINVDCSAWTIPAGVSVMYFHSTLIHGAPVMSSNTAMVDFRYQDCSLLAADVDAVLLALYTRRAAFTAAAPYLRIGGTGGTANAAPTGIYQDGDPPTTGNEYRYELVNDPETEGFKKWSIDAT